MDPVPLVVIDKENGGKADSLNVGINVARYPLVCSVDADSLLESDALLRVARPFIEDPKRVLAVGGIVRVANGCTAAAGRVLTVDLPKSWIARFQVVEYLRSFLGGRVAFSAFNCLLVISGAFGLFSKAALLAVGGYRTYTVGEDMELIVRLHHWARRKMMDYRWMPSGLLPPMRKRRAPRSRRIPAGDPSFPAWCGDRPGGCRARRPGTERVPQPAPRPSPRLPPFLGC
jgi:cellulose synthase/poly-beta-1,6-N-acetylglucosamine synthase-like glycosyltransferase